MSNGNTTRLTDTARNLLARAVRNGGVWINGEEAYADKALDAAVDALLAAKLVSVDRDADDHAQDPEDYATRFVPTARGRKSFAKAQAAGLVA